MVLNEENMKSHMRIRHHEGEAVDMHSVCVFSEKYNRPQKPDVSVSGKGKAAPRWRCPRGPKICVN